MSYFSPKSNFSYRFNFDISDAANGKSKGNKFSAYDSKRLIDLSCQIKEVTSSSNLE